MDDYEVNKMVDRFERQSKSKKKAEYVDLLISAFKEPLMEEVIGALFDCDLFIDDSFKSLFITRIYAACTRHDIEELYVFFAMGIFGWPQFFSKGEIATFFLAEEYDFIAIFCEIYENNRVGSILSHLGDIAFYGLSDFYHQLEQDLPKYHQQIKAKLFPYF